MPAFLPLLASIPRPGLLRPVASGCTQLTQRHTGTAVVRPRAWLAEAETTSHTQQPRHPLPRCCWGVAAPQARIAEAPSPLLAASK